MYSFARHTFWVLGLTTMLTSMALVGCGSSSTNNAATVPGLIATTGIAGTTTVICTGATPINTAYGCLPIYSCTGGTGWLAGEARCVAPITGGTGAQSSGTFVTVSGLQILGDSGRKTFELFLQNAGLCSPNPYGTIYFGASSCSAYSSAGYMVLQTLGAAGTTIPTTGTVVIGAGAAAPNMYNNSGWTTNVLRASFYSPLAANGAGFTGTGPFNFRFVVGSGFPGSSYQMSVDLIYNGTVFARGTLMSH